MTERKLLWVPDRRRVEQSELARFQRWLEVTRGISLSSYQELQDWSIAELQEFWECVWQFFDVVGTRGDGPVLTGTMPEARWFAGATLNYAENMLVDVQLRPDAEAVVGLHEDDTRDVLTWRELSDQVGAFAHWLRERGVGRGDRVCAVLPHIPATIVAMLATASLGAVWSVVGPDFGVQGIADRFAQLEPKVLLTVDGYRFNGAIRETTGAVAELLRSLPSVEQHVLIDQLSEQIDVPAELAASHRWSQIVASPAELAFESVEFSHPLWVLFSSGTTGKPKGIVHSHGGITLEAHKALGLQYDIRRGDRVYFSVATTWMVWNTVVDTLMRGATVITYDGSGTWGTPARHLQICAQERVTLFGAGAAVLTMIEASGRVPSAEFDLSSLRSILSTGSPLPDSTWEWVYSSVSGDVRLSSDSGGTDIASAFIGVNPFDPVYRGELQSTYLGVAAHSFDAAGRSVIDEVGEFVVTAPMPSMPVCIWGDDDLSRYRETYFSTFPGVWRQGDWVTRLSTGSFIIHGRSDSTINRGGIRMGSADICQIVNSVPGVVASMVIGAELEGGGYFMPLFVVLADGVELTEELTQQIVGRIRSGVSPRHVPDQIIAAPGVPTTKTGKLLEVPIKRLLQGASPDALSAAAAADPDILNWYVEFAQAFVRRAPV